MAQQPDNPNFENSPDDLPENIKKILDAINVQTGTANFEGFSTDDLRESYDWLRRLIAKKIDEGNGSKINYESQLIKIIHDEVSARWNEEVNKNELEQSGTIPEQTEIKNSDKPETKDAPEIADLLAQAKEEMKNATEAMESVVRKTKVKSSVKKTAKAKKTVPKISQDEETPIKTEPRILGLIAKAKKEKETKYQINIPGFKPSTTAKTADGETPEILKLIAKAKGEMNSAKGLMQKMAIKKGRGTLPRRPRGRPKSANKVTTSTKLETKKTDTKVQEKPSTMRIPKIIEAEVFTKARLPPAIEMPKDTTLDDKVQRLEDEIRNLQNKLLYLENTALKASAGEQATDVPIEIETVKPSRKSEAFEYDFTIQGDDEFAQLSSIIKKLRNERESLSADIYNMKMQYNSAKLRFERMAKSLEYAKIDLVENARQSKIYSKIREIDNLKKSLQHIKDDLASAGDSDFS